MNPDTGRIYSDAETPAAKKRGERVVVISNEEAALLNRIPPEERGEALERIRRAVAAKMKAAVETFGASWAARLKTHPAARLNGLDEADYHALKNAAKRARRARRGK